MPRRRHNIKKKKSFMFTTKHHSFSGVLGCVIALLSIGIVAYSIYISFKNRGNVSLNLSGAAMFVAISDVIGLVAGISALSERDIHKWVPIAAIIANAIMIAVWVLLILWGIQ